MLYWLAKFTMWFALKVYFKKITVFGSKHIPDEKPVILIVNHSASFLDAIILGCLLKRELYYYARSDVFKAGLAFKMMKAVHMIPIYNLEHSKEDLHRNTETFEEGEKVLARKKMLVIFPEGISRQERILLPLKKGTGRVAIHAASTQGFDTGLEIIPVGINYSFHRFRADVIISVGESTPIKAYEETYKQNSNKAIAAITRDIEKKFSATVIYVDQANRTDLINHLLLYFKKDVLHEFPHLKTESLLHKEKEICSIVSAMDETEALTMEKKVLGYSQQLSARKITDESVTKQYQSLAVDIIFILLGLPLAIGALPALPIIFLAKWIGDTRVTRKDFYTSVTLSVGGVLFLIYWLLLMVTALIIGNKWIIFYVFLLPVCLYALFWWTETITAVTSHFRYLSLKKKKICNSQ